MTHAKFNYSYKDLRNNIIHRSGWQSQCRFLMDGQYQKTSGCFCIRCIREGEDAYDFSIRMESDRDTDATILGEAETLKLWSSKRLPEQRDFLPVPQE